MISLSFQEQSTAYLARNVYKREKKYVNFIVEEAGKGSFDPKTENYLLVPVYVSEPCIQRYIQAIQAALASVKVNVLFFINGNKEQISSESFEQQLALRVAEIEQAFKGHKAQVRIVSKFFEEVSTIGQVRGMMCDLVVFSALLAKQSHPKIIFNDVDAFSVSDQYFENIYNRLSNPNVKMVVGPVYWGYKDTVLYGFDEDIHIPELYIYNEINQSILSCARSGEINFEKRILSEGPSMAFSGAAYCAVDGFDWSKACGEDDDFNLAIHKYNPNVFLNGITHRNDSLQPDKRLTIEYDADAWVVSDPRRILSLINKGKTGVEAWMGNSFVETLGSELSSADLSNAYKKYSQRMHHQDIQLANQNGDHALQQKIIERILGIALWICRFEQRIRNKKQTQSVLFKAGILPHLECPLGLKQLLESIKWRRCKLINQLVALN